MARKFDYETGVRTRSQGLDQARNTTAMQALDKEKKRIENDMSASSWRNGKRYGLKCYSKPGTRLRKER